VNSSIEAHRILQELRNKPIDTLGFPSHFSVAIQLRTAINDPKHGVRQLADIVKKDPLISARVICAANTAALAQGNRVFDIERAIQRVGVEAVKRIVLAVTMAQLARSQEMVKFASLSRLVWLNSLYCASSAQIIAQKFGTTNPNEAFFIGLSLNLGAFYMLYQAAVNKVLRDNVDDVIYSVKEDHITKTIEIMRYLEMPQEILDGLSVEGHEVPDDQAGYYSLKDIIFVSSQLANERFAWLNDSDDKWFTRRYQDTIEEIDVIFTRARTDYSG
jgi:HD-like signal output (HDOD) protein